MARRPKSNETAIAPVVVTLDPVGPSTLHQKAIRLGEGAKSSLRSGVAAAGKAGADLVRTASATTRGAGRLGNAALHAVGDLNGDGKIDEADFQIAKQAAGRAAGVAAREAGELGKAVARHEITKDAAAGAAVGALIAVPIPIIGPMTGAAFGAAVGMARGVLGSGALADIAGQVATGARKPARRKSAPRKKPAT